MSNDSTNSTKHKLDKEKYTFTIALIVIIPFMIFFGVVLLVFKDAILLEKMTALLVGLVAAVLGYYFGQRQMGELNKQVQKAQVDLATENKKYRGAKEDALDLSDAFDDIRKDLAEVKKLNEEINDE